MVADSLAIIAMMFIAAMIFDQFETAPDFWRITALVFIAVIYDPLCTSVLGATIGHAYVGIRVRRDTADGGNILFHFALLRYMVKLALGILSLLTVSRHPKGKALHDMVAGSVVVYAHQTPTEAENNI
jgi:uncharacterized RDD family membrane protein YckC